MLGLWGLLEDTCRYQDHRVSFGTAMGGDEIMRIVPSLLCLTILLLATQAAALEKTGRLEFLGWSADGKTVAFVRYPKLLASQCKAYDAVVADRSMKVVRQAPILTTADCSRYGTEPQAVDQLEKQKLDAFRKKNRFYVGGAPILTNDNANKTQPGVYLSSAFALPGGSSYEVLITLDEPPRRKPRRKKKAIRPAGPLSTRVKCRVDGRPPDHELFALPRSEAPCIEKVVLAPDAKHLAILYYKADGSMDFTLVKFPPK